MVLEVDRHAEHFLSLKSLALFGTSLVAEVTKRLAADKGIMALWADIFPENVAAILELPTGEVDVLQQKLHLSFMARLIRCRGKVFTRKIQDEHLRQHRAQLATRQQLRATTANTGDSKKSRRKRKLEKHKAAQELRQARLAARNAKAAISAKAKEDKANAKHAAAGAKRPRPGAGNRGQNISAAGRVVISMSTSSITTSGRTSS
jgi:hypothetical protein